MDINALIFQGHPILEKIFITLGGMSLLVHFITEGIPRAVAALMGIALSKDHPAMRKAVMAHEEDILGSIQAAKDEAKKDIDAAKAEEQPPAQA